MTLITEKISQKLVQRQQKLAGALKKNLARRKLAQLDDKKDSLALSQDTGSNQTNDKTQGVSQVTIRREQ